VRVNRLGVTVVMLVAVVVGVLAATRLWAVLAGG
jgi:hypothetical protein